MKKTLKIVIPIVIILAIVVISLLIKINNQDELIEISSKKELNKIYEGYEGNSKIKQILTLPISILANVPRTYYQVDYTDSYNTEINTGARVPSSIKETDTVSSIENTKEYSTTNIQVENVDEADITKTDGNYIYSISDDNVIITDVRNEAEIKIASKIKDGDSNTVPEDLILYENKLIIISEKVYRENATLVSIYNIEDKENPQKIKTYELEQPYYTSRCINGNLYVISSGKLKKEKDEIVTYYKEDEKQIDPGAKSIKRIKDINTRTQTIISTFDLNNTNSKLQVNSYLMDVQNAYVSENNIYLLEEKYKNSRSGAPKISSIFGLKGIFGAFETNYDDYYGKYTQIYKFNLLEDGSIRYDKKVEEKGQTINQFSIDEYEGNLRVALYNSEGSRVVVFDKEMKKIGETETLAKGENMYSSRFMGNKAYLVTYRTVDPLYVIDLSNPKSPKVLGELKIPGYSTYLHPYDENHIIGIGMQTQEKINRNSNGKVIGTTAIITGMKMALFDVTDVTNPRQISSTIIGDSRTTSAILTNHKALLFSKEKQLLAIPVNNYEEDFEITNSSNTYNSTIDAYKRYNKDYIAEGYFVYNLNLEEGFKQKGTITHEKVKTKYRYSNNSRMIRGLYIDNNLYTVSEDYIKVNKLEDLQELATLKVKED